MSRRGRHFFAGALALVAALAPRAAEAPRHDLHLLVNLSGPGSGIIGRAGQARSGLYRSADRATFEHVGPHHIRMFHLTHDPRDARVVYVAALDGLLRSPDRGLTWRITTSWDMTEGKAVAFDPAEPAHLYLALPDGIAFSPDGGGTWERRQAGIARAYTNALVLDRSRAGRVLAGCELGIHLSEDAARTWRRVRPTAKVTYDLRQSPHDPRAFVAATSADGLLASADGGETWRELPGIGRERTLHNIVYDPAVSGRLILCGWGVGVQVSEDGGATWVDRSAGLPRREVWSVAVDPDFPGRLYAAPFQEDVYASDDLGRTWRPLSFGKTTVFAFGFLPRSAP